MRTQAWSKWLLIWFFWSVNPQGLTTLHGQWLEHGDCEIVQRAYARIHHPGLYMSPCTDDRALLQVIMQDERQSRS